MTILTDRGEAALSARPRPDLSQLIHPIDLAAFQRDYWERKPLVVHRSDPGYYADLLTLDDVDRILSLSNVRVGNLRVVVNGKETPVSALGAAGRNGAVNALEELYRRYRTGSTVVLNALELRWEPLQRLSRALGAEISARLQMNIYLTPAGAQGFAPHYDTHDVFVAQVHGTKHWRLSSPPIALPLQGQPYDKSQPEPAPEQEFDLRAGDVIYLPRGTIHSATSNKSASVHITIGVHPVLFAQAFADASQKLFAEDVRFRRGLPIGFATDDSLHRQTAEDFAELADVLRARLLPDDMVARSVTRATSMSAPTLRHHLTDLEELDELWVDTRVRRRPGQQWNITVTDDVVRLGFHNKLIQLPAHVADEVRYVAESEGAGFTASDIPGDLDEPGRLVLVQTLFKEGFLTIA
jgi:ribosomal protein L16 Arg81 hydroxylase